MFRLCYIDASGVSLGFSWMFFNNITLFKSNLLTRPHPPCPVTCFVLFVHGIHKSIQKCWLNIN